MLDHISTIEELEEEAHFIDRFLNEVPDDDMNEAVERGNELASYIARTGKMLADAKYWKDQKTKGDAMATLIDMLEQFRLSATAQNEILKASCSRENYLVNWIDRLNRAATHQLEWARTVVSKAKEEMRLSNGINNQSNH